MPIKLTSALSSSIVGRLTFVWFILLGMEIDKIVFVFIVMPTVTAFANHNDNAFRIVRGIHEFCTNAIIALIFIHILAAIYHHFVLKDSTTSNMSKFWTTKR